MCFNYKYFIALIDGASGKDPPAMQETQVQSLGQKDPLEKEWQATPVFLSGESHGQRSLAGYSLCVRKESDMTENGTAS